MHASAVIKFVFFLYIIFIKLNNLEIIQYLKKII